MKRASAHENERTFCIAPFFPAESRVVLVGVRFEHAARQQTWGSEIIETVIVSIYRVKITKMHHFTLAHKQSSIAIRTRTWMLPDVRMASDVSMRSSNINEPSTMTRKVGCREDPGVRMLSRKDSASWGSVDTDMDDVSHERALNLSSICTKRTAVFLDAACIRSIPPFCTCSSGAVLEGAQSSRHPSLEVRLPGKPNPLQWRLARLSIEPWKINGCSVQGWYFVMTLLSSVSQLA